MGIELAPRYRISAPLGVHMAEGLRMPIIGDPIYGRPHALGMMLHAWKLTVPRPGKEPIVAEAPLPPRFLELGFALQAGDAPA